MLMSLWLYRRATSEGKEQARRDDEPNLEERNDEESKLIAEVEMQRRAQ